MTKYISIFWLVLRCLLAARKENLTVFSTSLTGRSKNLDPTGNPTGLSTRPVLVDPTGFHLWAATQLNSYKNLKKQKNRNFITQHLLTFRFNNFKIVAQHHPMLSALGALHQARCKKSAIIGELFRGPGGGAPALKNFLQNYFNFRPILIEINTFET